MQAEDRKRERARQDAEDAATREAKRVKEEEERKVEEKRRQESATWRAWRRV